MNQQPLELAILMIEDRFEGLMMTEDRSMTSCLRVFEASLQQQATCTIKTTDTTAVVTTVSIAYSTISLASLP